ncbi:MAG: hypothetical protein FWC78_01180 [Defluviitaleaceae bacterium]|nr:hypothetical protein [Defluviitaleaceae bacterium]
MGASQQPKRKHDVKKIVSYVGTLLMIISLGFVVRRFMNEEIDFSLLTSPLVIGGLIGVALVEGIGLVLAGVNYRAMVYNVSGIKVDPKLAVKVYCESNLYKYIPGGVMYVLGRNRLAIETEGLGHAKIALATVVEGALFAIAALVVAISFSFDYSITYIRETFDTVNAIAPIIVGLLLLVVGIPGYIFRKKIAPQLRRLFDSLQKPVAWVLLKRFLFALMLMALWGATFVAVLAFMGQPMTLSLAIPILGLYLLAWMTGFLTPGAPSGLGVREMVMYMFFGGIVYSPALLAAMVLHRVLTVMADVLAYLIALVYSRRFG